MSGPIDFDLPDDMVPPRKNGTRVHPADEECIPPDKSLPESPPNPVRPHRNGAAPLGRTMPNSIEAEEYLLSCCMLDGRDVVARCIQAHIDPDSFYDTKNGIVFERILSCYNRGIEIDVSIIAEELRTTKQLDEVGGYAFLTQVSGRIPTTAQAGYFIDKVREQAMLRQLIRSCTGAVEECYNFSGGIDELAASISQRIGNVINGANGIGSTKSLIDFAYPTQRDPNILLGDDDYLGRGAGMVLVSYAGAGKSSLVMQMGLNWGMGRAAFGLSSNGPLKVLIVEGEDSERYLGKVASSFAVDNKLSEEHTKQLRRNVLVHEVKGVAGPAFLSLLERLVRKHEPDLVIINPVYLYVEGDISNSADVKPFLLGLDAINAEKKFGWLLVHHTGKPTGKDAKGQRAELENWETMYMGMGSSFWANWPRASAMLEPRASNSDGRHYWLKFGKGWQNAGIVREYEENGEKKIERINRVALRYSDQTIDVGGEKRPMISWEFDQEGADEFASRQRTARENGALGGRKPKYNWEMMRPALLHVAGKPEKAQGFNVLMRTASDTVGISKGSFNRLLQEALHSGEIRQHASGALAGRYWLPEAPAKNPPVVEPADISDVHWPEDPA